MTHFEKRERLRVSSCSAERGKTGELTFQTFSLLAKVLLGSGYWRGPAPHGPGSDRRKKRSEQVNCMPERVVTVLVGTSHSGPSQPEDGRR